MTFKVKIKEISDKGVGIAQLKNDLVFVKNTYINEEVLVSLQDYFVKGSNRREGILKSIVTPNKNRIESSCSYEKYCGSCSFRFLKYKEQLNFKKNILQSNVDKLNLDIKICDFYNLYNEDIVNHYRNKSIRSFSYDKEGLIYQGFYESFSHKTIHIKECLQEVSWMNIFANELCDILNKYKVPLYDESKNIGIVRNLIMRDCCLEKLVCLSIFDNLDEKVKLSIKDLAYKFSITSIALLKNKNIGNKIVDGDIEYLSNAKNIKMQILDNTFLIDAYTFMQVNNKAMEYLYRRAIDSVSDVLNKNLALDLCCGVGTMTLALAHKFKDVIGVEINKSSIESANLNKDLNNISNVSFILDDIKNVLNNIVNKDVDAIIADPARSGLGDNNLKSFLNLKDKCKIALIFCSQKAFLRDIKYLKDKGFKILSVEGIDMFPNTMHFETLVILEK